MKLMQAGFEFPAKKFNLSELSTKLKINNWQLAGGLAVNKWSQFTWDLVRPKKQMAADVIFQLQHQLDDLDLDEAQAKIGAGI